MSGWVRLWHDMPTDPKWRTIARKSGQRIGDVIAVFTFLLVDASANENERGTISAFDPEDVGTALDLDADAVTAIMEVMQGKVLDGDRLHGWDKRQAKREREDTNSTQRVREFRKRQRETTQAETPCNATQHHETRGNALDIDIDIDVDLAHAQSAPEADASRAVKKSYAFQGAVIRLTGKDLDQWAQTYHAIPDLRAELTSLDAWLTGQPPDKRNRLFHTVSGCLNRKHQEATASRAANASGSNNSMVAVVLEQKRQREAAAKG